MAADMDPWVIFDARKTPRAEFEDWLETYCPSQVRRFGDPERNAGPVGWIAVYSPDYVPSVGDVVALQQDWERLQASGRPVNFDTVKELALNSGVLTGKWLMHLESGFKVDHAWEGIARATLDGRIAMAKVSPRGPDSSDSRHVICVYNQTFTDQEEVVRLDAAIRATGVKCQLSYKPDVYTYLGIYRKNRWKLCPTIYESRFDLEHMPRRSLITNKVTNTEVT
ncbi:CK068 protein, partial [Polyodon spathula]|nr:CK068 protein [Polyodon spathula]